MLLALNVLPTHLLGHWVREKGALTLEEGVRAREGPQVRRILFGSPLGEGETIDNVDIREDDVSTAYERALVLVRPDGQVAWRSDSLPREAGEIPALPPQL